MRFFKVLFVSLLSVFALAACGEKEPKEVGKTFLENVYLGNADKVVGYLYIPTEIKPEEKEFLKGKVASMVISVKEKIDQHQGVKQIEFIDESGDESEKALNYKVISNDNFSQQERLIMIKTKDGWKIKF